MPKEKHKLIADDQLELYKLLNDVEEEPKATRSRRRRREGLPTVGLGVATNSARDAADAMALAMSQVDGAARALGISTEEAAAAMHSAQQGFATGGTVASATMHGRLITSKNLIPIRCIITSIQTEAVETTLMMDTSRSFAPGQTTIRGQIPTTNIENISDELMGNASSIICEVFNRQDGYRSTSSGIITDLSLESSEGLFAFIFLVQGATLIQT